MASAFDLAVQQAQAAAAARKKTAHAHRAAPVRHVRRTPARHVALVRAPAPALVADAGGGGGGDAIDVDVTPDAPDDTNADTGADDGGGDTGGGDDGGGDDAGGDVSGFGEDDDDDPDFGDDDDGTLGWFGSDIADAVSDVASSVADTVTHAIGGALSVLPGDVQSVITQALASALYVGLAPYFGPQLAAVAFATPGVLKGESFDHAWTDEFLRRVKMTADILSAGQGGEAAGEWVKKLTAQMGGATDVLTKKLLDTGALQKVPGLSVIAPVQGKFEAAIKSLPATAVAKLAGVRDDMAQSAIDLLTRKGSSFYQEPVAAHVIVVGGNRVSVPAQPARAGIRFDVRTGKMIVDAPSFHFGAPATKKVAPKPRYAVRTHVVQPVRAAAPKKSKAPLVVAAAVVVIAGGALAWFYSAFGRMPRVADVKGALS